ncbi:MAG: PqqD family protein [Candidatus Omnitrophota bacterium]
MKFQRVIIQRNESTAWQEFEDNMVVVTPHTRKIHILSGAGCMIWQSLEEPKNFSQIVDTVFDEYEINYQQAEKDIEAFIQELSDKDIVKLINKT